MPFRFELALSVLRQTPLLLACVAILCVAVLRWRRHPRVSLLASAGALTMLLGGLIALSWDLFYVRNPNVAGGFESAERLVAWGVPLLQALGVVLLMSAIFTDRDASTLDEDDSDNP